MLEGQTVMLEEETFMLEEEMVVLEDQTVRGDCVRLTDREIVLRGVRGGRCLDRHCGPRWTI